MGEEFPYKNLDFKNTIFIIDSTTIAYIVSIIANGKRIKCIFERKDGIESDKSFRQLTDFADSCLNYSDKKIIDVPSPYFLEKGKLGKYSIFFNIYKFHKKMKNVFTEENQVYIGPATSSIMNVLKNESNIRYIYHGTGDYLKLLLPENSSDSNRFSEVKMKVRKFIVGEMIHMPNSCWNGYYCRKGYSMCNLGIPGICWIDPMKFKSEIVEKELEYVNDLLRNKKKILFCPLNDVHNIDGIDSNTTSYDKKNIEMVKKICIENSYICLKFHPSIYQFGNSAVIDLDNKIKNELNAKSIDLEKVIPDKIGGILIPLEALYRYVKFDTLLCFESSAVWNLSQCNLKKVLCISVVDGQRLNSVKHTINVMKNNGLLNDSFQVV